MFIICLVSIYSGDKLWLIKYIFKIISKIKISKVHLRTIGGSLRPWPRTKPSVIINGESRRHTAADNPWQSRGCPRPRAQSGSAPPGGCAQSGGRDAAASGAVAVADALIPRREAASGREGEEDDKMRCEVERDVEADDLHLQHLRGHRVQPVTRRHRGVGVEHGLQGGHRGEALLQHLATGQRGQRSK